MVDKQGDKIVKQRMICYGGWREETILAWNVKGCFSEEVIFKLRAEWQGPAGGSAWARD